MYKELFLLMTVLLGLTSALPTIQMKVFPNVNQAETLDTAQTKFSGGNWKHNFGLGNYGYGAGSAVGSGPGAYTGYAAVPVIPAGYAAYYGNGNGYRNGYGWKFG